MNLRERFNRSGFFVVRFLLDRRRAVIRAVAFRRQCGGCY